MPNTPVSSRSPSPNQKSPNHSSSFVNFIKTAEQLTSEGASLSPLLPQSPTPLISPKEEKKDQATSTLSENNSETEAMENDSSHESSDEFSESDQMDIMQLKI